MAHENRDINPETLGFVRLEKVKCGKPNCHCANGKKHKAYYLYFRDCTIPSLSNKAILVKKYLPRRLVKEMRRKIQIRKNMGNYNHVFSGKDDALMKGAYEKLANLPLSKTMERVHTIIKQVKKSQEYQHLTQELRLLR
ncbi:hypothetical protein COT64_00440 [Candidatus Shapirobacteria bacterium CG09_land_8_20_14_0_10_39_12]|uniref:DUF6788 domain-containing protein n=1 Tax=Candidatus Shapirobacteria bacterium CG09_land_8_20_14_0_10_39_12 TaxID=1974885 RepID=A0A2H0WQC6_9BACT|nr:MAG: hypothetical protein COT64_00440 [Candidatus Shapirobacteria bacterium CG09_land_8_20_14_0_10_39_12]